MLFQREFLYRLFNTVEFSLNMQKKNLGVGKKVKVWYGLSLIVSLRWGSFEWSWCRLVNLRRLPTTKSPLIRVSKIQKKTCFTSRFAFFFNLFCFVCFLKVLFMSYQVQVQVYFIFISHKTIEKYKNEHTLMKVNGDVDAIKERKACDWWHPTCYIVYNIYNII